jgi:hypothetical protein
MQKMQGEADNSNKERLAMLEKVITEHILIPRNSHVIQRSKRSFGGQFRERSPAR